METYKPIGYKTLGRQSYSGFSLEAKLNVDWIQRYRESPIYDADPNAQLREIQRFTARYS